jgi:virginiamycin A acetyltransferase
MNLFEEIEINLLNIPYDNKLPVRIWGAGNMAKFCIHRLKALSVDIECIVDPEELNLNNEIFKIPIKIPQELDVYPAINIVASKWYREISTFLLNTGSVYNKDFFLAQRNISTITFKGEDIRGPVFVGKHSYGIKDFANREVTRIHKIGAFCSIAPGAEIVANHLQEGITTHPFLTHSRFGFVKNDDHETYLKLNSVTSIGNDVWIGKNVTIMPGLTIGNGVIIGADSVVTKDIPHYSIAVGNPAKVQRYRFSKENIAILNQAQWWNWSDKKIKKNLNLFNRTEAFISELKRMPKKNTYS